MTKLKYDLVMKTREFREKTLCSVYYKPNKHKEKQFMPVDIDGYRYRLNKSTGEIENYTRQQTKDSIGASAFCLSTIDLSNVRVTNQSKSFISKIIFNMILLLLTDAPIESLVCCLV